MITERGIARQPAGGYGLALLAVATILLVSGTMLNAAGIPYEDDGGTLFVKIHPGSYLAIAAGAACIHRALLNQRSGRLHGERFELVVSLAALLCCMIFAIAMTGSGGLIALIDSFLPAILLAFALLDLTPRAQRRLRGLLRILLCGNALLAIGEAVLRVNIIPAGAASDALAEEFRPTALYDHPLTGASATLLMLFCAPAGAAGIVYRAVALTALLAFGERIPLACGVALLAVRLAMVTAWQPHELARRPGLILLGALLALAGTGGALAESLGSRLAEHLYWDGSAQARILDFSILGQLSWPQILLGCRREDLIALLEPMRLQSGAGVIENFWLVMIVTLGLGGFAVFCVSFASLIRVLWRRAAVPGRLMVAGLIVTASTSNSLGRKTSLLTLLVACVLAHATPQESA